MEQISSTLWHMLWRILIYQRSIYLLIMPCMIALFKDMFVNRIEVVRGGSVAIEALSTPDR